MSDQVDDLCLLSDGETSVSPTPATVPKKRGRPANPNKKPTVVAPPSGRGRGRPAKGGDAASKKKGNADGSGDEEGTASDGGSPLPNGDAADEPARRGRPPKSKRKQSLNIVCTGKARGRPKKPTKGDEDDEEEEENEDAEMSDYKPNKKNAKKSPNKGRGRPKKAQNSDESSDEKADEDEEKRPIGRPASGGVNLNISRSGRGQGRPKKDVAKRTGDTENGGDSPKKRGRPNSSGGKGGAYQPTGKPRGRPKPGADKESHDEEEEKDEEEDEEAEPSKDAAENSAEEDEDNDKVVLSDDAL